jgi:O-antigen ligase
MSRLQSVVTGIATAIALVLVLASIDVGKLVTSLHRLAVVPVALAVILLAANFALAFLRFEWTLRALGAAIERRAAAYAFALGNLAGQFFLNIIGQSLTRALVLQTSGVPMSVTVAATYLERLIALATVGVGAAIAALILYGSLGFELHNGGAYFLSISLALLLTLALAGTRGLTAAIAPDELRRIVRTSGRLAPAVVASLLAHLAMFGAYVVLVHFFAPQIGLARLAPAVVIVMFAAGLPISWAGWGLREFGAVYAFGAVGVPGEAAVIVAVIVGAVSLLIGLLAGGAVAADAWIRPVAGSAKGTTDVKRSTTGGLARALAPSDPILMWAIGILTACLIFFQLRVPTGSGELTVNAADPVAITALFFAAVYARTEGLLRLFPRAALWSIGGLAVALTLGLGVAWLGPGVTEWALVNRMLGYLFLLGYAAVPALVVLIAGERGRTILAETFVVAAAGICALQLIAYAVHLFVAPLPADFFGYLFDRSGQLEGYAQNSNAFAFQLLMAGTVLIVQLRSAGKRPAPSWVWAAAALLCVTLACARSRAGILCALGAVALAFVLDRLPRLPRPSARSLAVILVGGAALLVLGVALWGTIDRLVITPATLAIRPHAVDSDALRWQSTLLGWQAWREHPLFGGGLGTFLLNRETAGLPAVVIHSVPIWFMAEMGLVGLAAYVVFVGSLAFCGLKALHRHDARAQGLLIIVAMFVLMGLVHDVFYQRTFWFAAGLMLVAAAPQSSSNAVS